MKLRQLEYLCEVARCDLNVTAAAQRLHTSQPGISKQIQLLENELGVQIFARRSRELTHVTPAGRVVVARAEAILREVANMEREVQDYRSPQRGSLALATTHTQARYVLPPVVRTFRERYPAVNLHIHQGSPEQIAALVESGEVDFAIVTEALQIFQGLTLLPCYQWNRCVLVPVGHPLVNVDPLTLEAIAEYPIVTYVFGVDHQSPVGAAFHVGGLQLEIALTAVDAEVIKTYVRAGLGVGIIARLAYEPGKDSDLCMLDAGHLFEPSLTGVVLRRREALRDYVYEFIRLCAPQLSREVVDAAINAPTPRQVDRLFRAHLPYLRTR